MVKEVIIFGKKEDGFFISSPIHELYFEEISSFSGINWTLEIRDFSNDLWYTFILYGLRSSSNPYIPIYSFGISIRTNTLFESIEDLKNTFIKLVNEVASEKSLISINSNGELIYYANVSFLEKYLRELSRKAQKKISKIRAIHIYDSKYSHTSHKTLEFISILKFKEITKIIEEGNAIRIYASADKGTQIQFKDEMKTIKWIKRAFYTSVIFFISLMVFISCFN